MLWATKRLTPAAAAAASRLRVPLGADPAVAVPEGGDLLDRVGQIGQLVHDAAARRVHAPVWTVMT